MRKLIRMRSRQMKNLRKKTKTLMLKTRKSLRKNLRKRKKKRRRKRKRSRIRKLNNRNKRKMRRMMRKRIAPSKKKLNCPKQNQNPLHKLLHLRRSI